MTVAADAALAQSSQSPLGVCSAVVGASDHSQALASALSAVRAGAADSAVQRAVAANRCPFCGCSLKDPFTGKPLTTHSAS